MPTTTTADKQIAAVEKRVSTAVTALTKRGVTVTVKPIASEGEYQQAAVILTECATELKGIEADFEPIVSPQYAALQATYALRKKYSKPVEELQKTIRDAMKAFKMKELQAQQERDRESERLTREAHNKEKLAEAAKTKGMQTRLENQAQALVERAAVVQAEAPRVVKAAGVGTRKTVKWRLKDLEAVLVAVVEGKVSAEILKIDEEWLNQQVKINRGEMEKVDGIEVYDDIEVVRR